MKRINKSVSFNPKDPFEEVYLEHSERFTSFSQYIKRLIAYDLQHGILTRKEREEHVRRTP